jgi:thioredoxin reductase (NADPH)
MTVPDNIGHPSKQIIVYGAAWCPDCDRVKRLLMKHELDFDYRDIEAHPAARREVVELVDGKRVMPVVIVGDFKLINPANEELLDALGMGGASTRANVCDVIIIGGGVAGLSAAIYTTRERLRTLVIEKMVPGGQIMTTARVENYPGFPEPISGAELTDRLVAQAEQFGATIVQRTQVMNIESRGDLFRINCLKDGEEHVHYTGRTIILAVGSQYRRLDVPGEKEFTGYGVSYCGTCDAPFYKDRNVVAAGGGNTAVDEGVHLLKFVNRLTFVQKLGHLTATPFLVEELMKHKERLEILYRHTIEEIKGKPGEKVTAVTIRNLESGETFEYPCDGVFVWIGMVPNTDFLRDVVELDNYGFIEARECSMRTSIKGIFAAGDCRSGSKKQIATAAGEGVVAALVASDFLKKQKSVDEPESIAERSVG